MEKTGNDWHRFGLIGKNIGYSFSKGYFTKKFKDLGLDQHSYENFDLPQIGDFEALKGQTDTIKGFNVTIPYKEAILPYLTTIDPEAEKIGAVNTIKVEGATFTGYNTDVYGFQQSLEPLLQPQHTKALILGTGGASKAVAYVLKALDIDYRLVSRRPRTDELGYDALTEEIMERHTIIVNCTPLGTYPNISEKPPIPYHFVHRGHLLFDLIYNPPKTAFLAEGEARGATISNGLRMLQLQAERAWEIWTTP
ncbi:shikimate dehydrogenase [Flavobacteriaceae bacterium TP-CH-4]|uniref:Shikimate dehydrogenase n=1 Tax=Pelagihabitans pacificus TaxID=2696054 RepID=A0A967E8E1_9FLAO|nr:shikimate dehydrogenase [Pelagihabitans pacificus]NHF61189.1 shikimate dehydrogenase [Pelagihabitans pacificus]